MVKRYRRQAASYELRAQLGRGGFAEVWRATQRSSLFERDVCIKRVRSLDPGVRRAILEEARLLAKLSHGNIVTLFDVTEDRHGRIELVLEFVAGMNLAELERSLCGRGVQPSSRLVVAVGCGVASALAALAELEGGVVHRDISPQNVMLGVDGRLKLIDLGIARSQGREAWTASGVIKGKASYLSPEQARAEAIDPQSDVFALGVMLFELASGRHPWGAPASDRMRRVSKGAPPLELTALRPDLPPSLSALIHRLLEPKSHRRPRAEQLVVDLQNCLAVPVLAGEQRAEVQRWVSLGLPLRAATYDDVATDLREWGSATQTDSAPTVEVAVSGYPEQPPDQALV